MVQRYLALDFGGYSKIVGTRLASVRRRIPVLGSRCRLFVKRKRWQLPAFGAAGAMPPGGPLEDDAPNLVRDWILAGAVE